VSRHAGPPAAPDATPVPEPTYAERARTLVHLGRTGALATLSRRHPGHPFASVMPYAVDDGGGPLFLISTMAMHTQNLAGDRRASLLVTEPAAGDDPLATGRVTLMGVVEPASGADQEAVRAAYLRRHPNAAYWVDFEDFGFQRLDVRDVYYVGGFAAMDWVHADAYRAARPDPLADAAAGIIEHMNRDHADALLVFARVLARVEADEAVMVSVDRLGFKLRIRSQARLASTRISFPREVRTPEETRAVLIDMLRDARGRASA
jgi:putative heme iron utilization protein